MSLLRDNSELHNTLYPSRVNYFLTLLNTVFRSIDTPEIELQNVFTSLMFVSDMKPCAPDTVANRSEAFHAQVVSFLLNTLPLCVCQRTVVRQVEETRGVVFMQPSRLSGAGGH